MRAPGQVGSTATERQAKRSFRQRQSSGADGFVLVTGADSSHARSLLQFLSSIRIFEPGLAVIVYDLGLTDAERERVERTFPCQLRTFRYGRYPPHLNIRVEKGQYAWKPVIVDEVASEFGGVVCWMDAGNVLTGDLSALRAHARRHGFYSPRSSGAVADWTHPGMLAWLGISDTWEGRGKQNLNGACVCFDTNHAEARALLAEWARLALIKACIAPDGSSRKNHRQDQALLTVLAYRSGLLDAPPLEKFAFRTKADVSRRGQGIPLQMWIADLYENKDLTRMGHLQRAGDLNLGLGWLYYGLARTIRPKIAVVIGSFRGFVPLVFGRALADNKEGGRVFFIDPSFVDDFWKDPASVRAHFARHGVTNIKHFLMTTQEFAASEHYRTLPEVGIVFIDGHHSEEQARFDFETFESRLEPGGLALFHDTAGNRVSRMHGPQRTYQHEVKNYVDQLKGEPRFQVFDLPYGDGITLVRKLDTESLPHDAGGVY